MQRFQIAAAIVATFALPVATLNEDLAGSRFLSSRGKRHGFTRQTGLRGDSSGEGSEDPPAFCSCDCCTVVSRRPDEIVAGASIKCSPSHDHGPDTCGEQCAITEDDRVLLSETEGDGLDYERFCFFECKPAAGLASAVGEQCLILDPRDAQNVVDKHGSATDPAFVYGTSSVALPVAGGSSPAMVALTLARNVASKADIAAAPAAAPVTPEDAIKAATDGRYQAQTQEQGALTEARRTRAHEITEAAGGAGQTFSSINAIRASVQNGQASASRAAANAASAASAFKEARQLNWQTALNTASSAVDQLRAQVRTEAEVAVQPPPGEAWRKKASKAAAIASKPYLDSVRDAQQAVFDYSARASAEATQARALEKQSQGLTEIANALNQVGRTTEAQAKIREARILAAHAQKLTEWTQDLLKTAGTTAGSIDTYYKWAQMAASKAGADVMNTPV